MKGTQRDREGNFVSLLVGPRVLPKTEENRRGARERERGGGRQGEKERKSGEAMDNRTPPMVQLPYPDRFHAAVAYAGFPSASAPSSPSSASGRSL